MQPFRRHRNRRATLTLVALGPLIAELAFGSTPLHFAYLLILWLPIYGAGVLLIREAVVRAGGGWPSIVLLGVAYELVEDGIGLQALSRARSTGPAWSSWACSRSGCWWR